jgi:hypothetical protein
MTESPDPEKPIWELAEELDMEMFEWPSKLEKVIATLQELIRLIPWVPCIFVRKYTLRNLQGYAFSIEDVVAV